MTPSFVLGHCEGHFFLVFLCFIDQTVNLFEKINCRMIDNENNPYSALVCDLSLTDICVVLVSNEDAATH